MSKYIAQALPTTRRVSVYGLILDVNTATKYLVINNKGMITGLLDKPTNFSDRGIAKLRSETFGSVVAPATPEDTLVWVGEGNPPPEKEIRSDTLVPAMIYGNERVVPDYATHYVVLPSGNITVFSEEPQLTSEGWLFRTGSALATIGTTDPTDWQNSLRQI